MTEQTLEERVAELEGHVKRMNAFVFDKWAWTSSSGMDSHVHAVPIPIHGGSRKDSPLLGFASRQPLESCQRCGELPSKHPCPEVCV